MCAVERQRLDLVRETPPHDGDTGGPQAGANLLPGYRRTCALSYRGVLGCLIECGGSVDDALGPQIGGVRAARRAEEMLPTALQPVVERAPVREVEVRQ